MSIHSAQVTTYADVFSLAFPAGDTHNPRWTKPHTRYQRVSFLFVLRLYNLGVLHETVCSRLSIIVF